MSTQSELGGLHQLSMVIVTLKKRLLKNRDLVK
jgi:hypothetical protein